MSDHEKASDRETPKFTYKLDRKLKKYVRECGMFNWDEVSKRMKRFTPEECKERYYELCTTTKEPFTLEEDLAISHLVKEYGTKWELFVSLFKDRNINDIKNRYYRYIKGHDIVAETQKTSNFDIIQTSIIDIPLERLRIENLLV